MEELRIPGPTPCPAEVLQAMTKQMVNHRGREFESIMLGITETLKKLFQTKNDVFVLTGSGTGGMETAIVNTLSPGDKVLSVSNGFFGERFATIARQFGAEVISLSFDWGKPDDPDAVGRALRADAGIKAVLVTHNETSTGVTNDLAAISSVVRGFDKLLLVDAISSLGSINLPVDEWGCDVAITASQKGWMAPPGVAMVSVSEKAWQANTRAKMPRYYWDLAQAKRYLERGQTPWTPAVSTVFALSVALNLILEEGLANTIARHRRVAQAARQGVKSLGLSLFADESCASNTVTAISASNNLDSKKLLRILEDEYRVVLGDGQQKLDGKIFRIGHLGWVTEDNIKTVLDAIKSALPKAGFVAAKK